MSRPDYTAEDFAIESDDAKLLFRFLLEKRRVIRGLRRRLYLLTTLALLVGALVENLFDLIP